MVDGAPEIKELAIDLHNDLVQMPAQLRIGSHLHDLPLSNLSGEYRPKPVPPKSDGLVADVDPTLGQKILDVAQRQRVSDVHHHDQTDDFWRAVEISERVAHVLKLARPHAAPEFALTEPPRDVVPLRQRVQRLSRNELLSNLPLECRAVRSMLRHGFHPPEAQQAWSNPIAQSVHPQGRTPDRRCFSPRFPVRAGSAHLRVRSEGAGNGSRSRRSRCNGSSQASARPARPCSAT